MRKAIQTGSLAKNTQKVNKKDKQKTIEGTKNGRIMKQKVKRLKHTGKIHKRQSSSLVDLTDNIDAAKRMTKKSGGRRMSKSTSNLDEVDGWSEGMCGVPGFIIFEDEEVSHSGSSSEDSFIKQLHP
ncbi:hypothetical protein TSMEX_001575 [Taenia solium]|eukprot:TsM_000435000 transcript=TsM_000435000 gene=TsM_000435000